MWPRLYSCVRAIGLDLSRKVLAQQLLPVKRTEHLARTDALMCCCAVFGHRRCQSESSAMSEFGYKTWCLANESAILKSTKELQAAKLNARYTMSLSRVTIGDLWVVMVCGRLVTHRICCYATEERRTSV